MHVELARALVPVVHDLTATGAPVPRVVDDGWSADPGLPGAMLWNAAGDHGAGISVPLGLPRAEQLVHVADQVQDWAIEELRGSRTTNWPPCPRHPDTHPMRAAVRDGVARWTCPRDGTAVTVVGGLR